MVRCIRRFIWRSAEVLVYRHADIDAHFRFRTNTATPTATATATPTATSTATPTWPRQPLISLAHRHTDATPTVTPTAKSNAALPWPLLRPNPTPQPPTPYRTMKTRRLMHLETKCPMQRWRRRRWIVFDATSSAGSNTAAYLW